MLFLTNDEDFEWNQIIEYKLEIEISGKCCYKSKQFTKRNQGCVQTLEKIAY